jgi:hypothetical protein
VSPSDFERQHKTLTEQRRGKMPGQDQVPDYHEGPPFLLNALMLVVRLVGLGIGRLRRKVGVEQRV